MPEADPSEMPPRPSPFALLRAARWARPRGRGPATATAVLALSMAGLGAPSGALADHYLGSTLAARATVAEPFQQDTTFWGTAVPAPSGIAEDPTVVPENGQILQFQLRGFAGGGFGPQPIHFQDLRPLGNGAMQVIATSQKFMLPATDDVWSFDPTNFCVRAGDRLGFSDEGGFELAQTGVPFQVFGNEPGAQTQHYTRHKGVMNGATLTPSALPPGVELLMAAYEGTGGHSSPLCGGVKGIEFHLPQGNAPVGMDGTTRLNIGCQGPFPCNGQLTLQLPAGQTAAVRRRKRARTPASVLGLTRFRIRSHHTAVVTVRLTKRGRRLLRAHRGRLSVILAVSAGAGGPANTTTSTITLAG